MDFRSHALFDEPSGDDYIRIAVEAANYIQSKRKETPHGLVWDVADAWSGKAVWNDEISLYTGSAGIIHFFLQLDQTLQKTDSSYAESGMGIYKKDSLKAAQYIIWRWDHKRTLSKCFSPWAYTTGWAGAASALLEAASADPDARSRMEELRVVHEVADAIMADAALSKGTGTPDRLWSSYPGIVGDGGTILFLLQASDQLNRSDLRDFAIQAGRSYLGRGEKQSEGGVCYRAVDPAFFGYPQDYRDPNFPMGTAGIGFLLLRLYEASGDPSFLKAEEGIPEYLKAVAVQSPDGKAALLPHALPYRKNLFYLSYCHGPAGTARYYYKRYLVRNHSADLAWAEKLAEGVVKAGAPEIHSRGFWYIHCFCCGTAGILNLFLSMYAATKDSKWLSYAKRCGRVLYGSAQRTQQSALSGGRAESLYPGELADGLDTQSVQEAVQESQEEARQTHLGFVTASWYMAFDRVSPSHVIAPIGYYDGAAGIGSMLLELAGVMNGTFYAPRSIDDPFPGTL
jgi:lantibiotic modifying enzyme